MSDSSSAELELLPVQNASSWKRVRKIREQVFIHEQSCSPEEEWDGHDATSRHVIGWLDDTAVATARWRAVPYDEEIVAKLERFAILTSYRGDGYGSRLVRFVIEDARHAGFETFLVHAQSHLQEWYKTFGFKNTGRRFKEAGIPHVEMLKRDNT